jgi:hypothetical protein
MSYVYIEIFLISPVISCRSQLGWRPSWDFSRGSGGNENHSEGRTRGWHWGRRRACFRDTLYQEEQGRRFDVPKQRLYILCIFCIFVIFCISDILCIFDIFYIFLIIYICCCWRLLYTAIQDLLPLRMGWKAWIAEHGSGKEGTGAPAVIPTAGITSVIHD